MSDSGRSLLGQSDAGTAAKWEVAEKDVRYVIERLLSPPDTFAASIEVYRRGPRGGAKRYTRIGPMVCGDSPADALDDLLMAIDRDAIPQVRVVK